MKDTTKDENLVEFLNSRFSESTPDEILEDVLLEYGNDAIMSTGFGPSGLVLMHKLAKIKPGAKVFYIDTDLFFGETYALIDKLESHLGLRFVKVRSHLSLEQQANEYGDKLWQNSPDKCCYLRKVLPMKSFLHDKKVWITAIRRDQSETRSNSRIFSVNNTFSVLKVNPLANWSENEIWNYIHLHGIPYNDLHDKDYPSIGCIPCTSPVSYGGDVRSGRWTGLLKTECGIHVNEVKP